LINDDFYTANQKNSDNVHEIPLIFVSQLQTLIQIRY
jgi:hypothetical protein